MICKSNAADLRFNTADLANRVAVVLPSELWADPERRPTLAFREIGSQLLERYLELAGLISDYAQSPADVARLLAVVERLAR